MKKLILLIILCNLTLCASAKIIYVDANGTGDYPTIQDAIDDANDGDSIIVYPGRYYEHINLSGKAINLQSTMPYDPCIVSSTIIDGNNNGTCVTINNGEDANTVINGFFITDGNSVLGSGIFCKNSKPIIKNCRIFKNSSIQGAGGGVHNENSNPSITNCYFISNIADIGGAMDNINSTLNINDCTFINNSAQGWGGVMYNYSSTLNITNCTFQHNSAEDGGAIYNDDHSDCIIKNCSFKANIAKYEGGGIRTKDGLQNIASCNFTQNSAQFGGGIYITGSIQNIRDCTFNNNSVQYSGGGMYNFSDSNIINCIFIDNIAQESGGGLLNEAYNSNIANCTFVSNIANIIGGAMANDCEALNIKNCILTGNLAYQGAGIYNLNCDQTISNCTFSNNIAEENGGGIYNYDSKPIIKSTILWDNNAELGKQIYDDKKSLTKAIYSNIQTSWFGIGNIDIDPCFLNPDLNDFHLKPESLCINAGDPNFVLDPNHPTDLDGNPRISDGRIDMGCYEFQDPQCIEARLFMIPRTLNPQSRRRMCFAMMIMPKGITKSDFDRTEKLMLYPAELESRYQFAFDIPYKRSRRSRRGRRTRSTKLVKCYVVGVFDQRRFCRLLDPGTNDIEIVGWLKDDRCFSAQDKIRIVP